MTSRIVSKDKTEGFTLIEILVVMGVVGVFLALGAFVDIKSIGRQSLSAEEATLVSVLERARSRAMNNIFASRHGVHLEDDSYVIFREFPYDSDNDSNESIVRNENISFSGPDEVIFEQLSGNSENPGEIVLDDGENTQAVRIFGSGLIDW